MRGQKTGFYLDQRDNRARVERIAGGKAVLNVFAYTGGFSVYAARGGARQVVSVDASAPALGAATRNLAHNQHIRAVAAASHETVAGDAFETLARMGQEGRHFGMVIVDPPAFAQKEAQVVQALSAYGRLTRLSHSIVPTASSGLPVMNMKKLEKHVLSAKRATRPFPCFTPPCWRKTPKL